MFVVVGLLTSFSSTLEKVSANRATGHDSSADTYHGAMTVPSINTMDGFYLYGIFICAATLVAITGMVVGLVIRRRQLRGKRSGSFGSVIKMPSPKQNIFPISLYKQTEPYKQYCSANDLSNVEAQPDAGLASDRAAVVDWRRETGASSETEPNGKGNDKWVVHFKMRYDVTLEHLEIRLLRASSTAESHGAPGSFLFFNIYLTPHESDHKQSSLRLFDSTTATFDETFYFRLRNSDAVSTILRFSLYVVDGGQTRTCLGHVAQPLCSLDIFDGAVHYLTRDLGTLEAASIEGCLGETLVSLCYQMRKEKLKLRVLDARHLPPQIPSDSKFYLQIDIIIGDRIVKTKRTIPHPVLQDVFDCANAFLIPSKHMELCAFVFSIVEVLESNGQLVRERPWGRFTIGPCSYAHGTGVDHWKMMLANNKNVTEMWHVIARAY